MIDIKVEMSAGGADVRIGGEATVLHGEELKRALSDALHACQSVVVRTEDTLDVDLSCLQILCSAHRMALGLNKELSVKRAGPGALARAVENLGYSRREGCALDKNGSCLWTGGSHE